MLSLPPLNSGCPEEHRASFRILFFVVQADRTEKRKRGSREKRDTQCNRERLANGSRYECFPMAGLLRPSHEYLLRKKVLMRALLRARRGAPRSYAKSIRE